MATVLDIVRGISQAAANSYDGSHDKRYTADGEERKAGLRREEGDPVLETREIDGFNIKFHGNRLNILYHAEIKLKETHDKNRFENTILANLNDDEDSDSKERLDKITKDWLSYNKNFEIGKGKKPQNVTRKKEQDKK